MARKRMIDPSIWTDQRVGKLSLSARLLFIACVSNADDDGRLIANSVYLRSIAFLYDRISDKKATAIIEELKQLPNIHFYRVNDEDYLHLVNWEKYQNQRSDRRVPSVLPACPHCDVKVSDKMTPKCQPTVGQDDAKSAAEVKLSKDNTPPPIIPRPLTGAGDSPPDGGTGKEFTSMKAILEQKGVHFSKQKRGGANHEWQDHACRNWKGIGGKGNPPSGFFKFHKQAHEARLPHLLDQGRSYVADANAKDPEKLFYWYVNKKMKEMNL